MLRALLAAAAFASVHAYAPPLPVQVNFTNTYPDGSSILVQYVSDGIVRIMTIPSGANANFKKFALEVPQPPVPANAGFTVLDAGSAYQLICNSSVIFVSKASATTNVSRPDGTLLSGEVHPASSEPESQCGNGHGGPITGGCLRGWRTLQPEEQIYGFGVQFSTGINHAGQTIFIQTAAVPTLGQGQSHIPAPFFLSSLGYGVAINTHTYTYFDVGFAFPPGPAGGASGINLLHTADPVLDLYVFTGPSLAAVTAQYTQLYGRTALPPKFALGQWYHPQESSNQSVVEGIVDSWAAGGVPLAAVTIEPPWQTHAYSCTYVWNNATFWDPASFVARLNSNGTEVTLWQHAYIYNESAGLTSPLWEPIYGGGLASNWITWGGATPDWSLPAVQSIVSEYFTTNFIQKLGIAAFKLDECDGGPGQPWFFPDNATFPSGFSGAQMHNLFGLLYGFTYHAMFEAQGLRTFLKARASYMGGQRYPTTAYSDSYDFGQYLNAVVSSGFGGFTWAPELRSGGNDTEFARRAQLMLFSGLSSMDGWDTGYEPFPPFVSANYSQIFQTYYAARMQLQPALYAAYSQQYAAGIPAVRSLLLDFPSDFRALGGVVDEYLLTSLLVAPVGIGATSRYVYFPVGSGSWVDYWHPTSSPTYAAGQNASITAPDALLPVFQQAGSILPLADVSDATLLRLRGVLPVPTAAAASAGAAMEAAVIYDDDGRTTRYKTHNEYYRATAAMTPLSHDVLAVQLSVAPVHAAWTPAWKAVQWEIAIPADHPARAQLQAGATAAVQCTTAGTTAAAGAEAAVTVDAEGWLHVLHPLPLSATAATRCTVTLQV